ncbi:MAG: (d)CMP kinase [Clostridiales bacterium]|nr:(d)CMP kinase [Clostridiales bacterium]
MNDLINIAIDGPAGAGKSTIAKLIAKRLGIIYIDTGAMYRAVAFKCLNRNVSLDARDAILHLLRNTDIRIQFEYNEQKLFLDGENISDNIRSDDVSNAASCIAKLPEVRNKLVDIQRDIAGERSVVMDGRDIGTYVLPNADVKIFLTASINERAKRRHREYVALNSKKTLEDVIEEIKRRDYNDSTRQFAPLKIAEDAVLVDSSGKDIDQVVEEILGIIDNRLSID